MLIHFPPRVRYSLNMIVSVILGLGISLPTLADDIEVFTSGAATGFRPNILFVLDYSGSMGGAADSLDPASETKLQVLQTAMHSILEQNVSRINAGVSIYSNHTTGILWPVSDLSDYAHNIDPQIPLEDTLRGIDIVKSIIDNRNADGSTATVGALMEAAAYFGEGNVSAGGVFSGNSGMLSPQTWSTTDNRFVGDPSQPHPATYQFDGSESPATYISPIANECQSNFVVLISDGRPTVLDEYPELASYVGPVASCESLSTSIFTSGGENAEMGNCGPELVTKMANTPLNANYPDSPVNTYTIGFNIGAEGADYLTRLANDGGGEFFEASKPSDLTQALDDILQSILGSTQSFTELSIDVNKATFSDDNRVYFPQFKPSSSSTWSGNLKGYFLNEQGLIDTNGLQATVTDGNGTRYVDTAQSFWSSAEDGNHVELGGASEKLAATNRNIYTYTDGGNPNGVILSSASNHSFSEANGSLDYNLLGIPNSSSLRTELIEWLHDASMGDALHSKSTQVKYDNRTVIFQATNHGLLHAFDATTPTDPTANDHSGGEEIFAFIPPELLPNLEKIRNNDNSAGHIYGLDGSVTRWHTDVNKDGIVNGTDTMTLIIGMRRGGRNYYALDVTDPEEPRYMWKIEGGSTDFPDLQQSWSRMSLITVLKQGSPTKVLVFGGGYDANVMDAAVAPTTASGNTIYMIDKQGNKLWSASHSSMNYSIPSDLRVIDSNDDGFADRIYTGDLGGQIWRVDFDDVNVSSSFKVNRLADLSISGFQPFFYPPSVSLNNRASSEYLSVAIGSGNRANPLRAGTSNKLFMLKDSDVAAGNPASGFSTITMGQLYDATSNDLGSSTISVSSAARTALNGKRGWYVNLAAGEKSLSSTLTFEGKLLATTFSPNASGSDTNCTVQATSSRYYAVHVKDATPAGVSTDTVNTSTSGLSAEQRSRVIATSGIPSAPIVVFPKNSDQAQILVDRTTVSRITQRLNRVMWHPRN